MEREERRDVACQAFFEDHELLSVQAETKRLASYYIRVQLTTLIVCGSMATIFFLFQKCYASSRFVTGLALTSGGLYVIFA